jgi:ABC-type molybdate transport system substrate-binding protein
MKYLYLQRYILAFAVILTSIAHGAALAALLEALQVAYAGSMGSMMDGGVKPAIAKSLHAELQGRAQGSTGLANLIVAGSIRPDVFIAVTPGPMRTVLMVGKTEKAIPIARTEMVIAYSPKSRFASDFATCNQPGSKTWWQILETPELRFGRTDPVTDPQGINIIFALQLAARFYSQPDLANKILGPLINPQQIFQEAHMMALSPDRAARRKLGLQNSAFCTWPSIYYPSEGDQPWRRNYGVRVSERKRKSQRRDEASSTTCFLRSCINSNLTGE